MSTEISIILSSMLLFCKTLLIILIKPRFFILSNLSMIFFFSEPEERGDTDPDKDHLSENDVLTAFASDMDFCLSSADENNFIKYHTMTSCWGSQASTTDAPPLCNQANDDKCLQQPVTFAAKNFTSTDLPYETPIGIAKDGHIIVGPYNDEGELWSCDDHDVCNGVFLSDNSYAYVVTYRFPYVAGCWGPGPTQEHKASCSSRSCEGEDGAMTTISLGMLSSLVYSLALLLTY